jgi:cell division protein FtsW
MVQRMQYDRWLLLITLLLTAFGALMVYSSTSVITPAFARKNITQFFYLKRHILTILLSLAFLFISMRMRITTLKKAAIPLLVFSFLLLVVVFVPKIGVSAGGARRWIRLWPSTFQPSELVKIAMVVYLARYLSSPSFSTDKILSFLQPIGIMAVFQVVFLMQPDFGAAMSLGLLTITMLVISGVRMKYIMYLSLLAIPLIVKLAMNPYRLKRILSFLNPWDDPQGAGFQLTQSFIALGSGGLAGVGLGQSKQKLSFLPEVHTDFIFSIVGEELGFIGALFLVFLFLMLFLRGTKIAQRMTDTFSYHLVSGLSMMIALQAMINFFVTTGLVPTKGLPLPFISYGGSSLLISMVAVGLLLNLSRCQGDGIITDKAIVLTDRKKTSPAVYGRKPEANR